MSNFTAKENNVTAFCGLCVKSPVNNTAILPYILISLPANGRVLWLMVSSPVFWTDRMEVSEFHLVFTELLLGFLGQPLMAIGHFSYYMVAEKVLVLINLIFTVRVQLQSAVCIERYLAVVHPVLYLRYKLMRYRMSLCCAIWLENILLGVVEMFFCSERPESLGMYASSYFAAIMVNSFCCLSVLRALKQLSPGEGERQGSNLVKKRAFIVLIFQLTTLVGLVPLVTMFFMVREMEWHTRCIWQPLAYAVMVWLGAIYPLLYLQRAGKHLVKKDLCVNCF